MAMNENRDYRSVVSFEVRAKETDTEEESYIVEGYATTFNEPYVLFTDGDKEYKEEIAPEALDDADMTDVVFVMNHDGRVYARTRNGALKLDIDEKGLHFVADLGLTSESRKVYEDIKVGNYDQMSWAFIVRTDEYDTKTRTRRITKVDKVFDVSCVNFPASPYTSVKTRAFVDGVIDEERRSERERVVEEIMGLLNTSEVTK